MQLEQYEVDVSGEHTVYEFISVGKRGRIEKIVAYTPIGENSSWYNLGFGDVEAATGAWTDEVISDNGDSRKVLATVAATVVDFLNWHSEATVYAQGNADVKNHLYRRGIEGIINEISQYYKVEGFTETDGWEPFERNRPYEAFLIRRI